MFLSDQPESPAPGAPDRPTAHCACRCSACGRHVTLFPVPLIKGRRRAYPVVVAFDRRGGTYLDAHIVCDHCLGPRALTRWNACAALASQIEHGPAG